MSGLFNSYVIEPALRQARRFSASHDQSPQASQPTVLPSHAETDYLDLAQHDTTRTNSPVATRTHSPSRLVSTSLRDVADVPSGTIDLGSLRHTSAAVQDAPLATPANHLNTTSNVEMTLGNFRSMSLDAAPTHSFNPTHRASQQLRRSLHNSIDSRHARMDSASAEDDDGTSATTRSRNDSSGSSVISGALPANDGMLALRQKVHQIREMALSSEEKAKRMHALMTADYENYKASTAHERHTSHDAQTLPIGLAQRLRSLSPASTASTHDPDNKYNIDDEDLESTYCPASPISDSGNEPDETPEAYAPEHGCTHYKRNIKIQCFDCRRWYTCRLCHDEAVPEHHLERKKIQNMLCMFCKTPQPAAEYCKKCGTLAAQYYCDICKLWDNDARRRIYHCDDCGICRRGEGLGKDYVHCKVSDFLLFLALEMADVGLEMQCLYIHRVRHHSPLCRACNRVRLSHLWRLPVHVIGICCSDEVWPLYSQGLLRCIHADLVQMPHLQPICRQHGIAMAEAGPFHRGPAHARAVQKDKGLDHVQRLHWPYMRLISLAREQMRRMRQLQHQRGQGGRCTGYAIRGRQCGRRAASSKSFI